MPVPQFKGATIAEIAPITANERETYMQIFQSCNPIDGVLYGNLENSILVSDLTLVLMYRSTSKGSLSSFQFNSRQVECYLVTCRYS